MAETESSALETAGRLATMIGVMVISYAMLDHWIDGMVSCVFDRVDGAKQFCQQRPFNTKDEVEFLRQSFGKLAPLHPIAGEPTDVAQPTLVGYSDFCGDFPAAFAKLVDHWKSRIASLIESDRRIVLWGGGAKAVSFLNMLGIRLDNSIEYVVDVNPRKARRFVPGTAQEIVPPEYLCDYRPDVVVVMNPVYAAEIQSKLETMRLRCDVIRVSSTVA